MDEGQKDIEELRQKIENAGMPEDTKKEAVKELNRLSRMSPMAADYSLTRNYIEWLAVLPWAKSSGEEVDIIKAKGILDEDHYDLKKVKDGAKLSPVLLIRGNMSTSTPLQIVDGYHRVCASYYIDEDADIPSRMVDAPKA